MRYKFQINIDAYENDSHLIPFLRQVLQECKKTLENHKCSLVFNIYKEDFVLHNGGYLNKNNLLWRRNDTAAYDLIISNPPYYKLGKHSPHAIAMAECVCGQPNIYTFFMALSANMLKTNGQMVFITPRSFCSGLYYKKFRRWFLNNVEISRIHLFESRKEIFDKDDVLQENIILKATKRRRKTQDRKIVISTSRNRHFETLKEMTVPERSIIGDVTEESFIKIPVSSIDLSILNIVEGWPFTLRDLGLDISTGPVVAFRAKQYLADHIKGSRKSVPLLWMHNMRGIKTVWPSNNNKKPSAIRMSRESERLLLPVTNYVLVRRFSSKEQPRRLYATVLLESDFPYEAVGIENHLNYIYKPGGKLSVDEAYGLSAILNTAVVDNYFRSLNGNTQVNATDVRSMPFPTMESIKEIGKIVRGKLSRGTVDFDSIVGQVLSVDHALIDTLNNKNK